MIQEVMQKRRGVIRIAVFLAVSSQIARTLLVHSSPAFADRENEKPLELFVDASSGADSNPGTAARPLKTINTAAQIGLSNRRSGIATKIIIRPGRYREFIQISGFGPDTGASITFQASEIGTAVISGSDLWNDWRRDSARPQTYSHSWPYRWGPCIPPRGWPAMKEIGLRREMIFVNGKPLTQVLSPSQMHEGTFFIDEGQGRVSFWPPSGTDMAAATIEVATRPGIFESDGVSNLSFKGLVFEHANSCISTKPNAGVVISGGTNNLVEDTTIRWNNWIGFDFFSVTNSTVRRLVANSNGELGINGFRLKNVIFEDVESSYNNWRGGSAQFTGYEPSGGKFLRVHHAVLRNYKAVGNQGRGLWFDTDNLDITVEHAFLAQNLVGGIDLEANVGPITIQDSRICSNQREGIQNNDSESVRLSGNVIYNNQRGQIIAFGASDPRPGTNWETNEAFSATAGKWSLSRNTIVGTDPTQLVYETFVFPNHPVNGSFLNTLSSDDNTWFNPQNQNVFQIDPGGSARPAQNVDFSQWQFITGQDKHSRFGPPPNDPAALCAAP